MKFKIQWNSIYVDVSDLLADYQTHFSNFSQPFCLDDNVSNQMPSCSFLGIFSKDRQAHDPVLTMK